MEMISGIIFWQELFGVSGIARELVEIDHAVERAACANPIVDGFTLGFAVRRLVKRTAEGRQGGCKSDDAMGMSAFGDLPERGDDVVGADCFGGVIPAAHVRPSDVVDAFEDN